jgi:IS5 family transposase
VTDASVHGNQCLEALLDPENSGVEVFADSAYRADESEQSHPRWKSSNKAGIKRKKRLYHEGTTPPL